MCSPEPFFVTTNDGTGTQVPTILRASLTGVRNNAASTINITVGTTVIVADYHDFAGELVALSITTGALLWHSLFGANSAANTVNVQHRKLVDCNAIKGSTIKHRNSPTKSKSISVQITRPSNL